MPADSSPRWITAPSCARWCISPASPWCAWQSIWCCGCLPRRAQLLRIVPLAALNSGVLGTVLVERTQSFTLGQSLGFGLGSGIGYVLAVLLVTEARHRLRSKAIPKAFRGLPITLVYIGVLALAIYGFTGHSVIL